MDDGDFIGQYNNVKSWYEIADVSYAGSLSQVFHPSSGLNDISHFTSNVRDTSLHHILKASKNLAALSVTDLQGYQPVAPYHLHISCCLSLAVDGDAFLHFI